MSTHFSSSSCTDPHALSLRGGIKCHLYKLPETHTRLKTPQGKCGAPGRRGRWGRKDIPCLPQHRSSVLSGTEPSLHPSSPPRGRSPPYCLWAGTCVITKILIYNHTWTSLSPPSTPFPLRSEYLHICEQVRSVSIWTWVRSLWSCLSEKENPSWCPSPVMSKTAVTPAVGAQSLGPRPWLRVCRNSHHQAPVPSL